MASIQPIELLLGCNDDPSRYPWRTALAAFDFDHTLVRPKTGRTFAASVDDWTWWRPSVPERLQALAATHSLLVFSNQNWNNNNTIQMKISQIKESLSSLGIPILVVIATEREWKKPSPRLFQHALGSRPWDAQQSFYCGDAAGRSKDFSDSDRSFATAIGIPFLLPETCFPLAIVPSVPTATVVVAKAIVVTTETQASTTFSPALPPAFQPSGGKEIIIMAGYPGSGKSTIAALLAQKWPSRYQVLSGDVLKTAARLEKAARQTLASEHCPIIDATNPSQAHRRRYSQLAAEFPGTTVQIIHMTTSFEESIARDEKRAQGLGCKAIPKIAFYTYRKNFQVPDAGSDGATVISV